MSQARNKTKTKSHSATSILQQVFILFLKNTLQSVKPLEEKKSPVQCVQQQNNPTRLRGDKTSLPMPMADSECTTSNISGPVERIFKWGEG